MNKKRIFSIIIFVIGILTLIAGVVFLIIKLVSGPAVNDGNYLVSIGKWQEEDASGVIWNFSEIGKGTLTTNNHLNDYEFQWSIEDGKLKIETDWLYTINDEFEYTLNQSDNVLVIQKDTEEIKFIPVSEENEVDPTN